MMEMRCRKQDETLHVKATLGINVGYLIGVGIDYVEDKAKETRFEILLQAQKVLNNSRLKWLADNQLLRLKTLSSSVAAACRVACAIALNCVSTIASEAAIFHKTTSSKSVVFVTAVLQSGHLQSTEYCSELEEHSSYFESKRCPLKKQCQLWSWVVAACLQKQ
jgi:hypothetical protein